MTDGRATACSEAPARPARHRPGCRIGIVTGLAAEAATLGPGPLRVALSAADPARASRAARSLVADGAQLLVSYGLAAGLDPRLGPGAILLPEAVFPHEGAVETPEPLGVRDRLQRLVAFDRGGDAKRPPPPPEGALLPTDRAARDSLRQALGGRVEGGVLAGVEAPVTRPERKLVLFAQTRALGADMESHAVARAARAAGISFVALRVVSDPSNRAVPRCALAGIAEDGRVAGGAVARDLLRRPWECFDLLTLALDAAQAMRRLRRVGRRAAPVLAGL